MAHSIQQYLKKSARINDADLIVILGFALQIMAESSELNSLQTISQSWKEQLYQYGPGVIDLKLDEFIQTSEHIEAISALLENVVARASNYGSMIPAEFLNRHFSVQGIRFCDYKVSSITKAAKQLQILLVDA